MSGKIVYGFNAVREALRTGTTVHRLYLATESRAAGFRDLIEMAKEVGAPYDFVPQARLNTLAGTHEHQGIAASVSPVDYTSLSDALAAMPARALVLVADQVQHPKNLGLLVRTAAGAGASAVIVGARGGALLDESVLRASAGTLLHTPLVLEKKLPDTLRKLKAAGFWTYALSGEGTLDCFSVNWPERCALVVGNETKGLRPIVRNACDEVVRIPLAAELNSLNVAVAAGIGLFQAAHGQGILPQAPAHETNGASGS